MNSKTLLNDDPMIKLRYLLGNLKANGLKPTICTEYLKSKLIEKDNNSINN